MRNPNVYCFLLTISNFSAKQAYDVWSLGGGSPSWLYEIDDVPEKSGYSDRFCSRETTRFPDDG